jgi:hypothetical protein
MTPKEKAEDLLSKYYFQVQTLVKQKQCALIAVDEILNTIVHKDQDERLAFELLGNKFYWEEVKQEIEKL